MSSEESEQPQPQTGPDENWRYGPPPWVRGGPGSHRRPPPWLRRRFGRRHFFVLRFLFFFGGLLVLFLAALGLSYLLAKPVFGAPVGINPLRMALVLCAVPLGFTVVATVLGLVFFRRFGSPLVDVLTAVDTVAAGDLSVRVRESSHGEMGRLARSFNRMAAELERSEQQRRNLTADVAHELRTPLHIIQGNLEGLLDGVYQPTPEHIQATLDETRLLARLVADLQTLSLAEAGQLPLHKAPQAIDGLLEDVVTSFAGQAAEAGVNLRLKLPAGRAGLEVSADPDRLDQVFSNLVANALRHTPSGGSVTLRAEPINAGSFAAGVRVTVADTGSGIAPADLPYIFERFWRGDRARTRQPGAGSGLGLAIVRQLVHSHGGQVRVESELNRGTTFTVDLIY